MKYNELDIFHVWASNNHFRLQRAPIGTQTSEIALQNHFKVILEAYNLLDFMNIFVDTKLCLIAAICKLTWNLHGLFWTNSLKKTYLFTHINVWSINQFCKIVIYILHTLYFHQLHAVNFWWLCSEEHKNSVHSGIRVYY